MAHTFAFCLCRLSLSPNTQSCSLGGKQGQMERRLHGNKTYSNLFQAPVAHLKYQTALSRLLSLHGAMASMLLLSS